MSPPTPVSHPRQIVSPPLAALGVAATVIAIVVVVLAIGALNRTYLQVEVEARDLITGEVLWVRSDGTNESPSFGGDLMFLEKAGATLAIDDTGIVVWRVADFVASRLTEEGGVLFLQDGGAVIAVDPGSGALHWRAEGWLGDAAERYAIVRSEGAAEVVEVASGAVVHREDSGREAATDGETVAFLERRTLRIVRPASDVVWEIAADRWRRLLAVIDPIVVVDEKASASDAEAEGWQRRVVGCDSRTGRVQWEVTIPAFGATAGVDAQTLLLGRGKSQTRIDAFTGEILPSNPATALTELTKGEESILVERFERVDDDSRIMVLRAGDGNGRVSETIAVDVRTQDVVWTLDGLRPVAVNAHVAALYDASSFHLVDSATGTEFGVISGVRQRGGAVATDRYLAVVAGGQLVVVDESRTSRTIASGLGPTARIEVASGDIVVVHTRPDAAKKRFLAAYDIAAGEELWTHRVPTGGDLRLAEDSIELVKGSTLIEIGLTSGELSERKLDQTVDVDEPRPRYTVAAFDPEMSRLLWSSDLERGEQIVTIGNAVLILKATATYDSDR